MKNKIYIAAAVVLLGLLSLFGYRLTSNAKKSPPATVTFSQGNLDVKVTYCRPSKRERRIFGEKGEGALVPYGEYWRLGANAATEITFAKNTTFAGQPVSAGIYRMYAIPGKSAWKVVLNSQTGKWGAFSPNHDKDVLTVEVPATTTPDKQEQFTISFAPEGSGAKMDFSWDGTLVRVPLMAN